ncbi:MAG: acyltransferase family protein, partial [Eubacterium sp.]|nr:acyltransferase family protein [Eubacterium sp.]
DSNVDWIDIAKGIGIICVMIGHLNFGYFKSFVYFFHVPLFFFLSGFVFESKNIKPIDFIKKEVKRFVIPYYFWAFFYFFLGSLLLNFVISGELSFAFKEILKYLFMGKKSTIWFLSALLSTQVFSYIFIKAFNDKRKYLILISVVMYAIGYIYYNCFNGIGLPVNVDTAFMAMIFSFLDIVLKEYTE